jgi:hypothetical protein
VTYQSIVVIRVVCIALLFKKSSGFSVYNLNKWKLVLWDSDKERGGKLVFDEVGNIVGFEKDIMEDRLSVMARQESA